MAIDQRRCIPRVKDVQVCPCGSASEPAASHTKLPVPRHGTLGERARIDARLRQPEPFGAEVARTEKEADPECVAFVEGLAAAEGGTGLCYPSQRDVRGMPWPAKSALGSLAVSARR